MGHRRISNKRMKQIMQEILPNEPKSTKDDSLVEGKEQKCGKNTVLEQQDLQK